MEDYHGCMPVSQERGLNRVVLTFDASILDMDAHRDGNITELLAQTMDQWEGDSLCCGSSWRFHLWQRHADAIKSLGIEWEDSWSLIITSYMYHSSEQQWRSWQSCGCLLPHRLLWSLLSDGQTETNQRVERNGTNVPGDKIQICAFVVCCFFCKLCCSNCLLAIDKQEYWVLGWDWWKEYFAKLM